MYYLKKSYTENIKLERMNAFTTTPNCNLRLLPLSKSSLLEHIKQAALQSDWLWNEREKKFMQQDVFHFVDAKINVKTKVLCKYSRYITHFFNKSDVLLLYFYMFSYCF